MEDSEIIVDRHHHNVFLNVTVTCRLVGTKGSTILLRVHLLCTLDIMCVTCMYERKHSFHHQ